MVELLQHHPAHARGLVRRQALSQAHDRWLVGTVEEVAERLAAYEDAGVSRVMLQQLDHRDSELTALIGDRLVPAVRQ